MENAPAVVVLKIVPSFTAATGREFAPYRLLSLAWITPSAGPAPSVLGLMLCSTVKFPLVVILKTTPPPSLPLPWVVP